MQPSFASAKQHMPDKMDLHNVKHEFVLTLLLCGGGVRVWVTVSAEQDLTSVQAYNARCVTCVVSLSDLCSCNHVHSL